MKSDNKVLIAENIHKNFGKLNVLNGIDFEVEKGEVISIIGPSGSGKSTLIRCFMHLELINKGKITLLGKTLAETVDNKVIYPKDKEIRKIISGAGMVFQQFNLFPHKTTLENIIEAPVVVMHEDKKTAIQRAEKILAMVGLENKRDVYPIQLSGGQQQRVSIARSLALDPQILFFDEPTSALDPELTGEILKVIRDLASKHMTMVIVTHEIDFARNVSDRIVFMDEGLIVEQGTPEQVIDNPQNVRTKSFLARLLS